MSELIRNMERRYDLTTKRGWLAYVTAPDRQRPEELTRAQLKKLSSRATAEYDELRAVWNANLGPIKTPQFIRVHDDLWNILNANRQDGGSIREPAALDAFPGLGKTTIANQFGVDYHRRQLDRYGALTEEGHERIPVVRLQLTDETNRRDFNSKLCRFYNLPGYDKGTANHLENKAIDAAQACETTLVIVDDVHFLDMRRRSGRAVANHFKALSNNVAATFLHVGVGLAQRGLFDEGLSDDDEELAQNGRRITPLTISPFEIETEDGRQIWRSLLLAIEFNVALTDKCRGMIADDLSDLLFARSTGHFASLMSLIRRSCEAAIASRAEVLTEEIVSKVKIDGAAERSRQELLAAMQAGKLSSRPEQQRKGWRRTRRPATA
jgi:AAA domain